MSSTRIRRAAHGDVESIVALLADDDIAAGRESPDDLVPYRVAFVAIDADDSELLVVAECDGHVVATLQLSFMPGLSRRGALRCRIDGVRVAASARRTGLGTQMIGWAIDEARERGCDLVQLTSDKARVDANRFYGRLGFTATHEGSTPPEQVTDVGRPGLQPPTRRR